MYKKALFLVSLGVLLLSACDMSGGTGKSSKSAKKIDEEKAEDIMNEIKTHSEDQEEQPFSFEYIRKDVKGDDSEEEKYVYKDNLDGEMYCSWDMKENNKNTNSGFGMIVKNETYEVVAYYEAKEYDENGASPQTYQGAIAKKDNASYETQLSYFINEYMGESYSTVKSQLSTVKNMVSYDKETIENYKAYREMDGDLTMTVAYSSTGKGSLIVTMTTTPKDKETYEGSVIKVVETITFTNYRPTGFSSKNQYNDNSSYESSATLKYGKNKISLPSGWAQYLYIPSNE